MSELNVLDFVSTLHKGRELADCPCESCREYRSLMAPLGESSYRTAPGRTKPVSQTRAARIWARIRKIF
jgi:hypothetical protein